MIRRNVRSIGLFTTIIALTLAAGMVFAQETQISGTVSSTDPATRTISFTDGSVVRLQPGAVVIVNGREAALAQLTPGTSATVVSRVPSTTSVGTSPASSTYGVTGTVAQVDRQNGVITLQDGRAVRLSGQSFVWQATPIQAIQPGSQIFVGNVQPAAVMPQQPVAVAPQQPVAVAPPPAVVGTVRGVDRNTSVIALNDGTYVKVLPTTRVQSGGRTMAITELRPGDGVAVWPSGGSNVTETATVPRGDAPPAGAIKADYIEVTRVAS
jgi:preprotein translocase subunit YajC